MKPQTSTLILGLCTSALALPIGNGQDESLAQATPVSERRDIPETNPADGTESAAPGPGQMAGMAGVQQYPGFGWAQGNGQSQGAQSSGFGSFPGFGSGAAGYSGSGNPSGGSFPGFSGDGFQGLPGFPNTQSQGEGVDASQTAGSPASQSLSGGGSIPSGGFPGFPGRGEGFPGMPGGGRGGSGGVGMPGYSNVQSQKGENGPTQEAELPEEGDLPVPGEGPSFPDEEGESANPFQIPGMSDSGNFPGMGDFTGGEFPGFPSQGQGENSYQGAGVPGSGSVPGGGGFQGLSGFPSFSGQGGEESGFPQGVPGQGYGELTGDGYSGMSGFARPEGQEDTSDESQNTSGLLPGFPGFPGFPEIPEIPGPPGNETETDYDTATSGTKSFPSRPTMSMFPGAGAQPFGQSAGAPNSAGNAMTGGFSGFGGGQYGSNPNSFSAGARSPEIETEDLSEAPVDETEPMVEVGEEQEASSTD